MRLARWVTFVLVLGGYAAVAAAEQPLSPNAVYRVVLKSGRSLASYGDAARVGDRVIFNLVIVRADGTTALQLVSLPVSTVDVERTTAYANALRATVYATTRGEAEYAAMLAEFGQELSVLASLTDRNEQLARAIAARQRLATWPRDHFNYRVGDVQRLLALLDDIINEVPRLGPNGTVSLDLSYDATEAAQRVVLPPPGAAESIESALAAAAAADIGEERIAILRTATAAAPDERLKRLAAVQLEKELEAELRYAALANEFRRRAETARRAGRVSTVERLQAELPARDAALGGRRPRQVQSIAKELGATLDATRARREALDRFNALYRQLTAYERQVRRVFSGLSAVEPVLTRMRDREPVPYEQTLSVEGRLQRWRDFADALTPPGDVAGIHATLVSAVRMALEACVRRRLADVTRREAAASESASAAAAALLLAGRARTDLGAALLPPRD